MGRLIGSVLVAALMSASAPAYAQPSYIITLTNGNTLSANSYTLEGGKVHLKYPVGEVTLPISEVVSISAGAGGEILQARGVAQPKPEPAAGSPRPGNLSNPSATALPGQATPAANARQAGIKAMRDRFDEQKRLFQERRQQAMAAAREGTGSTSSAFGFFSHGGGDPETDALIDQLDTEDEVQRAEVEKKLEQRLDAIFDEQ